MTPAKKRANDAILRNGRQTKQDRLEVPSTTEGRGSRSKAMEHERKLLAQRRVFEEEARKKYDELDAIFQKMHEINEKIEDQREKQTVNTFQLEEPW